MVGVRDDSVYRTRAADALSSRGASVCAPGAQREMMMEASWRHGSQGASMSRGGAHRLQVQQLQAARALALREPAQLVYRISWRCMSGALKARMASDGGWTANTPI